jgi:hypothetical protein
MKTGGELLYQPNYRRSKQSKEYLGEMDQVKSNASPYART